MCDFSQSVVLQGNHCVKGNNIDINKLESRIGVQHSIFLAFKEIYIVIEDVVRRCDASSSFVDTTSICCQFFFFGDMNNAPRPWVNSLQEHIIILKGFEFCVFYMLKATVWDRRLNLCSLTMNQVRPFKIPSVAVFSLSFFKDISCQKKGPMVGL